ncbi:helix-turn-helix domain-containing protein [Roseicitreum antarcticum]|uniref:Protein RodZ, contains Xre-like HTH and DUF4115 domains n=1 Tax=Roseicitreum antarcticum TaxID=564137 RepID=A0A1H3A5A1_9RHOB|nr:RodZ domain-containing protein [Roseicitreum antarcticum]SDX24922.1 protein RodZ, contains Xre-like HTH and DUF4115 domains [Roseicitreum antarcticum]
MKWRTKQPTADDTSKQLGFDDFELKLGDLMRGERATLNKSLLDVQRELHIRAAYIAAIENGDIEAFEAPNFVAGYVRSYSRYLGMDPEWAYAKFCDEHNFSVQHGMSEMPKPKKPVKAAPPEGHMLSRMTFSPAPRSIWERVEPGAVGSIAVLLALIAGLGYAGWTVLQEVQRVQIAPSDRVPSVMAELDPVAIGRPAAADTPGSVTADLLPEGDPAAMPVAEGLVRVYRPQALDMPVMVSRDGPISEINPRQTTERTDGNAIEDAIQLALRDEAQPAEVQVIEPTVAQVELLAVRPSWVRVRAANGTVLFEKILDAGERYTVPQTEEPATLRAGNSGSLYFVVNGDAYGPAAPGAQIVNNVALSADALQQDYVVADLSRDADLARMVDVAQAE